MSIPVEVVGVRIEMPSNQPIVLLKEIGGIRYLPIWVGAVEASAIAFAQQNLIAKSWYESDPDQIELILADMIDKVNRGQASSIDAIRNAVARINQLTQ